MGPAQRTWPRYSDDLFEFFYEMDIPYIGADNLAVEKVAQQIVVNGEEETVVIPLHGALLRNPGISINEILDLRELSPACARDRIYEFMFTAAPLQVERGTGAPVTPVVLKATGPDRGGRTEQEAGEEDDGDETRGQGRRDRGRGRGGR